MWFAGAERRVLEHAGSAFNVLDLDAHLPLSVEHLPLSSTAKPGKSFYIPSTGVRRLNGENEPGANIGAAVNLHAEVRVAHVPMPLHHRIAMFVVTSIVFRK